MNRNRVASVLCFAVLFVGAAVLRGDEKVKDKAVAAGDKPADLRAALVGTWKMASMKVNGQDNPLPDAAVTYKHVTPGGFTWLSYPKETGQIFRCAGGTWTLAGDAYTETIEYGMGDDFDVIKKQSHPFTCRIEGDTWHHTGKLANGTTIDERWTRVKPAEAGDR